MKRPHVLTLRNAATPEKTREFIFDELRRDFAEWMTTDLDRVWRPAIELTKGGNELEARTLLPGIDADTIEVSIAPDVMMIKAELPKTTSGYERMTASVHFPQPIDTNSAFAEFNDGMLSIKAKVAGSNVRIFKPRAA